jgi:exosome complex component MTR3
VFCILNSLCFADQESSTQSGSIIIAHMPSLNEVTQLWQTGDIDFEKAQEGIEMTLDGCSKIYAMMRLCILPKSQ